jgi:hypothetical protein
MKTRKPKLPVAELNQRIDAYFKYIKGQPNRKRKIAGSVVNADAKEGSVEYKRKPEPPTITGLALYLGFSSRHEFEENERKPRYAKELKRARLKIEAEYEKKLHLTSAAGAIFALKSLGWNDDKGPGSTLPSTLDIRVLESGPELAQSEKEVTL